MGSFQGGQSYCSSGTWAPTTADACRKRNKQAHLHHCSVLFFFSPSCHHLFSLTENMIISLPPMWFTVGKERWDVYVCVCVCVCVWLGSGLLKESVVVFARPSPLDAPCVSLTLSLIIRYTASCWGGQVLLGLSYIRLIKMPHAHTHTYTHTYSRVVVGWF